MARYDTQWQSKVRRKKAARIRWAQLLVGPSIILALVLGIWAVFFSPLFGVRHIEVQGASHFDSVQVRDAAQAASGSWWQRVVTRAHFFGWPDVLPQESVALVPGAKSISVDRQFFSGTVLLTVVERDPVGVWCFEATGSPVCQWFDEEGVVYGRAFVSQGSLVPVIHDRSQEKAGEGRRVLPREQLEVFLNIVSILRTRAIGAREMRVVLGGKQEVTMTTYNGPELFFTLRVAPDHVAPVLDDFIKKGTLSSLQYIDFRSPKRAFYQ